MFLIAQTSHDPAHGGLGSAQVLGELSDREGSGAQGDGHALAAEIESAHARETAGDHDEGHDLAQVWHEDIATPVAIRELFAART